MRSAVVKANGRRVGVLTETDAKRYTFEYDEAYLNDKTTHGISLTLPKRVERYESEMLFPFFFSLLSEGANKKVQCTVHHIDERDSFGLLLATAMYDTIGEITIEAL